MSEKIGTIIGYLLGYALNVWVIMLVLGWVSTYVDVVPALSFVQTLGALLLARYAGWALWPREPRKPKPKADPFEALLRASASSRG